LRFCCAGLSLDLDPGPPARHLEKIEEMTIIETHPDAVSAARFAELFAEGNEYARSLKVGDDFRGSHGEADHRGLTGIERRAFGSGAAQVFFAPTFHVATSNTDEKIVRISY
jgi:hypothetical protein